MSIVIAYFRCKATWSRLKDACFATNVVYEGYDYGLFDFQPMTHNYFANRYLKTTKSPLAQCIRYSRTVSIFIHNFIYKWKKLFYNRACHMNTACDMFEYDPNSQQCSFYPSLSLKRANIFHVLKECSNKEMWILHCSGNQENWVHHAEPFTHSRKRTKLI